MKKILLSLLAVAALASCSKMTVEYEAPQEIGFKAVAGNITKAPVDGTVFPTGLNLFVNAYTEDNAGTSASTPNYIDNGEFTYLNTYGNYVTDDDDATDAQKKTAVWGGGSSSENRNPYYWPNEKTLHFSGYSNSGSKTSAVYNPSTDVLTISNYTPGVGTAQGANDLMWFPSTKHTNPAGYGKDTKFVPVSLYHTCSWITFLVQGDASTGAEGSRYVVTSLNISNIDQTATVTCSGENDIEWSENIDKNETYTVNVLGEISTDIIDGDKTVNVKGISLSGTYDKNTAKNIAKNIETGNSASTGGNIVVIPQTPGVLEISYSYISPAGKLINEVFSVANNKAISLALAKDSSNKNGPTSWEPGKHYIYTITIKANEILVAPTPVDWTDQNWNVTVE